MAEEKQTAKPVQAQEKPTQPSSNCDSKDLFGWLKEWPELKGSNVEEAKRKIKEDMAEADIQVVPPDSNFFYGCIIESRRVCLFVDDSGTVTKTPHTR